MDYLRLLFKGGSAASKKPNGSGSGTNYTVDSRLREIADKDIWTPDDFEYYSNSDRGLPNQVRNSIRSAIENHRGDVTIDGVYFHLEDSGWAHQADSFASILNGERGQRTNYVLHAHLEEDRWKDYIETDLKFYADNYAASFGKKGSMLKSKVKKLSKDTSWYRNELKEHIRFVDEVYNRKRK